MAERLDSIYLNPETTDCALLSAGSLLEVVDAVVMVRTYFHFKNRTYIFIII